MITIFDKQNVAYFIRPCPLINITWVANSNEDGQLGGKYDITLTGSLLDNGGSPIFNYNQKNQPNLDTSFSTQYYPEPTNPASKPPTQNNPELSALNSILAKQIALRELFGKNCMKIEVASVEPGATEPIFQFYPKFISINFSEGVWVHKCDYTITLEAQFILDKNNKIIGSESYASKTFKPGSGNEWPIDQNIDIEVFLSKVGGFIEDFQESWSLEPEEGNGNTFEPYSGKENITKIYRLTRNITAKGKNITGYECFGTQQDKNFYKAHEQARRYVANHIGNSGLMSNDYDDYPGAGLESYFASGIINLSAAAHGGFNHSRNENIDITQGTYSVQDTWILSSGSSYENYSLSLSSSDTDPRNKVSIDGTIKGLTSIPASGSIFGGNHNSSLNTGYENAINKYRTITNHGQFGLSAHVYKRAQNAAGGITLNHIPLSISLATNEFTGEINYTIEYDDRPPKFVDGVIAENISVSDTYPGDVFAVIPVIGRPTGPVLQYIGGRTEYQRSLNIELVVPTNNAVDDQATRNRPDYTEYKNRQFLLQKPSIVSPTREDIVQIINAYSPGREPGIRKYFVSPPQETWDPKEGRYTLNINWTYELNY